MSGKKSLDKLLAANYYLGFSVLPASLDDLMLEKC